MTPNRRIFLNIVATYGRSLYALAVGLITARWTLMSLGEVDYGLMGVVGGLIGFVAFFNNLMAGAVGRFYAFAVGEAQKVGNEAAGLENCRRWFNVAVLIHTVLPTILIIIGYPIGVWAVENYLVIPPDRIDACIWVWRFSCIACFMGMVNVPFQAMYTAKQEIAELTIYGFATTTLHAGFLYYMITHPGFWLVKLSAWTCFLGVVPQLLILVMAIVHYSECRFVCKYLWDVPRMRELFSYAAGRSLCAFAQMFSSQGLIVAVNKLLGLVCNAAMTIGNTVVMHSMTLYSSCGGAMMPAITNAAGRGDFELMRALSYRMCKLATFTTMIFAVPLILEADTVLDLWLEHPPAGAAALCAIILVSRIVNGFTDGHWMAIFALGKIMLFNICESIGFFLGFASAVVMMWCGFGLSSVGYGMIIGYAYALVVKLILGERLCGFSIRYWGRNVFMPFIFTWGASLLAGAIPRQLMAASFIRIVASTIVSELVLLSLTWFLVFDFKEKEFVLNRLCQYIKRGRK